MASSRSDIVSFIGLSLAYGAYVLRFFDAGIDRTGLLGETIGFYIVTALVMAAIHVVAALVFGKAAKGDPEIERDIARRAGRNANVAVMSVMWAVPFLLALPQVGANLTIVACVAVMGLAEIVRYGSRLVYRGLGPRHLGPRRLGSGRNQRALAG